MRDLESGTRTIVECAVVLALVASAAPVSASLGGPAESVDADRVKLQGALMRLTRSEAFAMHEIRTPSGTMIREYVSPSGVVFAVVWQGPALPDFRQVLGDHFADYRRAVREARTGRRGRGAFSVSLRDFVVESSGHPRAFFGRAYLPGLLPQGVRPDALR
jgi:hypothetical protein